MIALSVMHEYSVELRISGAQLVPEDITQSLGVAPSLAREVGERKSEGRIWQEGLWAYNGLPADAQTCWGSLEEGLTFLLDRLEPLSTQIQSYKQNYDLVIWCGHFQSSFDGGPTLSPKLMRRLADFGVDLYIDNYYSDSKQDDVSKGGTQER